MESLYLNGPLRTHWLTITSNSILSYSFPKRKSSLQFSYQYLQSSSAGPILESKGMRVIFQKKGKKEQKMLKRAKKEQNVWKFEQTFQNLQIFWKRAGDFVRLSQAINCQNMPWSGGTNIIHRPSFIAKLPLFNQTSMTQVTSKVQTYLLTPMRL